MARGKIALALLLVLILLSATQPSLAQQGNGTSSHHSRTVGGLKPTTVLMIIAVIAILVLITLFSLYMNGCTCARARHLPRRPFHSAAHNDQSLDAHHCRPRGLDLELVEAFPTAVYGDVKAHMAPGTNKLVSLECAVCLAEFADADELRVLPACCHVFHPGCIDPWLAGARHEGARRRPDAPARAVDQRTPGRLTSFLRSMSWRRHHRADESEAGEENGGGSKRIHPATGAPAETPSGSGSGGDDKKESSDVEALSRV